MTRQRGRGQVNKLASVRGTRTPARARDRGGCRWLEKASTANTGRRGLNTASEERGKVNRNCSSVCRRNRPPGTERSWNCEVHEMARVYDQTRASRKLAGRETPAPPRAGGSRAAGEDGQHSGDRN
jgi:hypothetical protein